jgi:cytochrome P450 family 724 subfamily B1
MEERRKGDSPKKAAFVDVLLSNNEMSQDDKVTFVLDTLLAGYETTYLLTSMLVYFLAKSPKYVEQLKVQLTASVDSINVTAFVDMWCPCC